jgi:hypothetical protein
MCCNNPPKSIVVTTSGITLTSQRLVHPNYLKTKMGIKKGFKYISAVLNDYLRKNNGP